MRDDDVGTNLRGVGKYSSKTAENSFAKLNEYRGSNLVGGSRL